MYQSEAHLMITTKVMGKMAEVMFMLRMFLFSFDVLAFKASVSTNDCKFEKNICRRLIRDNDTSSCECKKEAAFLQFLKISHSMLKFLLFFNCF